MSDSLAWLGGLNDLRLALAVRLGIGSDKGTPHVEEAVSEKMQDADVS